MKDIVIKTLKESIRVKEHFVKENMEGLLAAAVIEKNGLSRPVE